MIKKNESLETLLADARELDTGKHNVFYKLPDIQEWDSTENTFNIGGAAFKTTSFAMKQLLKKLHIPAPYYQACSPELRDKELHEAFQEASNKVEYCFKIKEDKIYGIVPKQYYPANTSMFVQKIVEQLPADCELKEYSLDLSELRMRLISKGEQFIDNDTIMAGLDLRFSEVGATPFMMQTTLYRLVCSNGMMLPEGTAPTFKMPMTRFKDDQFNANVSMIPDRFYKAQKPFAELFEACKTIELPTAGGKELEGDLKTARDLILPSRALQRDYGDLIMEAYDHDENLTLNGLLNAVTRIARDLESSDKTTLEMSAGAFLSKLYSLKQDHEEHNQEFIFTVPNFKRLFTRHS